MFIFDLLASLVKELLGKRKIPDSDCLNFCVYLGRDMHYYSVPYKYISFRIQVVYTATIVKIYTPDGMLVREWDRDRTLALIPPNKKIWLSTVRPTG